MLPLNHPKQLTTFHQYTSFTKCLCFVTYGTICATISQIFSPPEEPKEPKNSNFTKSFIENCPQFNPKSPKHPNLILILTMKLVYTYFSQTLPVGALISVATFRSLFATFNSKSPENLGVSVGTSACPNTEPGQQGKKTSCSVGMLAQKTNKNSSMELAVI